MCAAFISAFEGIDLYEVSFNAFLEIFVDKSEKFPLRVNSLDLFKQSDKQSIKAVDLD